MTAPPEPRRTAVTLRRSPLPRAVTDVPAASTMGFRLPADGGANVSGDWFDVS